MEGVNSADRQENALEKRRAYYDKLYKAFLYGQPPVESLERADELLLPMLGSDEREDVGMAISSINKLQGEDVAEDYSFNVGLARKYCRELVKENAGFFCKIADYTFDDAASANALVALQYGSPDDFNKRLPKLIKEYLFNQQLRRKGVKYFRETEPGYRELIADSIVETMSKETSPYSLEDHEVEDLYGGLLGNYQLDDPKYIDRCRASWTVSKSRDRLKQPGVAENLRALTALEAVEEGMVYRYATENRMSAFHRFDPEMLVEIKKDEDENPDKNYVAIVIARDDHNDALKQPKTYRKMYERLKKMGVGLRIYEAADEKDLEDIGQTIADNYEEHGAEIVNLMLIGHGKQDSLKLSNHFSIDTIKGFLKSPAFAGIGKYMTRGAEVKAIACSVGRERTLETRRREAVRKSRKRKLSSKNHGIVEELEFWDNQKKLDAVRGKEHGQDRDNIAKMISRQMGRVVVSPYAVVAVGGFRPIRGKGESITILNDYLRFDGHSGPTRRKSRRSADRGQSSDKLIRTGEKRFYPPEVHEDDLVKQFVDEGLKRKDLRLDLLDEEPDDTYFVGEFIEDIFPEDKEAYQVTEAEEDIELPRD